MGCCRGPYNQGEWSNHNEVKGESYTLQFLWEADQTPLPTKYLTCVRRLRKMIQELKQPHLCLQLTVKYWLTRNGVDLLRRFNN